MKVILRVTRNFTMTRQIMTAILKKREESQNKNKRHEERRNEITEKEKNITK